MIVYCRNRPFPKCRHCGERLPFWIPGLPDENHSHPECAGIAAARRAVDALRRNLEGTDHG